MTEKQSILFVASQPNLLNNWQQLLSLNYTVIHAEHLPDITLMSQYVLIVLDAELIDQGLLEISNIKQFQTKFLIVGQQWSEDQQVHALVGGAVGYCEVSAPASIILQATESIMQGDIWIQRHLVHKVIGLLVKITAIQQPDPPSTIDTAALKTLSSRELDVAKLIRQGTCNRDIAATLFISERTVKAHLSSIFKKLNVSDRLHLGILLKDVQIELFQQHD